MLILDERRAWIIVPRERRSLKAADDLERAGDWIGALKQFNNILTQFPAGEAETRQRLIELLTEQTKREAMGQRSLEIVAPHHIQNTLDAYEQLYEAAISRLKDRDDRENPIVLDQINAASF